MKYQETPAPQSFYGGQISLSTQLTKPNINYVEVMKEEQQEPDGKTLWKLLKVNKSF